MSDHSADPSVDHCREIYDISDINKWCEDCLAEAIDYELSNTMKDDEYR